MSEFYAGQVDFTFTSDTGVGEKGAEKWNWAASVFCDPLAMPPRLQTKWASQLPEGGEAALYSDFQTRDTELGFRLLEARVPQLKLALHCFQNGLVKNQRAITTIRTRLDAIEKINQSEPNPALRHPPEVIAGLQRELTEASEEFEYLRGFTGRLDSLASIIELIADTSGADSFREQCFRLIGLSWKGQMKQKAFQQRFPHLRYHVNQQPGQPLHFNLPGAKGIPEANITIDEATAGYLIHCLETIATMALESMPLFDAQQRKQYLSGSWSPPLMMLRAIVELFHYCNFELPYQFSTRYVDRDEPVRIWNFQAGDNQWSSSTEEQLGDRLKRQAAEIASLLISPPPFLSCTDMAELSRYCRPSIAAGEISAHGQHLPYASVGLARLDCDQRNKVFKFQSGYELSAQLLDQLVATQPHLTRAFQSALGGTLLTLRGLAKLEPAAFKAEGAIEDSDRFSLLSRFWRLVAKHRPLALLGHDYAKAVYAGMAANGEPPPDRSSLLSVHLSSVFTQTAMAKGAQLNDPIAALVLSDQIRLVELINESWAFANDCFMRLAGNGPADLEQLFKTTTLSPEHETVLARSFNSKWLQATQSIWSLIRAAAPELWRFWTQLSNKISVQDMLTAVDAESGIDYLCKISAETIRLMLLVETCSPVFAERLIAGAEDGCREMLGAFAPFAGFAKLVATVGYYFDLSIQHDRWLAFTSNFHRHLKDLSRGLEQSEQARPQLDMLKAAITQLEIQYPDIAEQQQVSVDTQVAASAAGTQKVTVAIDEAVAQSVETICQQLLGGQAFAPDRLPEMIGLARIDGMGEELRAIAQLSETLKSNIEDSLRPLIFSSSTALADINKIVKQASAFTDAARTEVINYLVKVKQFVSFIQNSLSDTLFCEADAAARLKNAAFADSESRIGFFLCSAYGATLCSLSEVRDEAAAIAKARDSVMARVGDRLPNWQPEILMLGGGRLRCGKGVITLCGIDDLNPVFSEPKGAVSARLLWYALKMRFEIAQRVIGNQIPGVKLTVEI